MNAIAVWGLLFEAQTCYQALQTCNDRCRALQLPASAEQSESANFTKAEDWVLTVPFKCRSPILLCSTLRWLAGRYRNGSYYTMWNALGANVCILLAHVDLDVNLPRKRNPAITGVDPMMSGHGNRWSKGMNTPAHLLNIMSLNNTPCMLTSITSSRKGNPMTTM